MKFARFAVALFALALASCATLSQSDRIALQHYDVPPLIYDKMVHGESLSVPDIVELSKKGLSPRFIIRYLRSTDAVYHLTSQDVVRLSREGLDQEVLDYLLATPEFYGPRGISGDPYFGQSYPYGYYPVIVGGFHHHHSHR